MTFTLPPLITMLGVAFLMIVGALLAQLLRVVVMIFSFELGPDWLWSPLTTIALALLGGAGSYFLGVSLS